MSVCTVKYSKGCRRRYINLVLQSFEGALNQIFSLFFDWSKNRSNEELNIFEKLL